MRDASKFGAETTASEVAEGIDLRGKLALVTGGSSGIGQETARVLAERGAHVVLTARDVPKGEGVAAAIRESADSWFPALDNIRRKQTEARRRHVWPHPGGAGPPPPAGATTSNTSTMLECSCTQ